MSTNLTDPIFHNENAARGHFEAIRWPNGPVCPHCGVTEQTTLVKGKSHRPGMYQCNACREPFTVTIGSVMESSHLPLTKWALGFHLMAASKKGVSAHQLMRMLGIGSYRTAWFMAHRIREAMADIDPTPLGGEGKTVEADETYFGGKKQRVVSKKTGKLVGKQGPGGKAKVVALVERGGKARSFMVDHVNAPTISKILLENASTKSALMTDEAGVYPSIGLHFASHEAVMHSADEYVRGNAHTNTIEGFFPIFKRGMKGIYQHCGEQHLHRYLAEFDFRYSNRAKLGVDDTERAYRAIKGAAGKRLTYKKPRGSRAA
jgi:transposase-like protein